MSAITFPNNPSADDQHTVNGITYTFTDGTWVAVGQSNFYSLPIASPTTLGGIKGGGTDISVANDGVISFSGTLPGPKTFTFTVTGNGQTTVNDPQTGLNGAVGDYTITGNDRRGIVSGTNPTIHINEEDTIIFNVTAASQPFRLVWATASPTSGPNAGGFEEIGTNSASTNTATGQGTESGTVTWVSKEQDGDSLYQGGSNYYYQDCDQNFTNNPTTYKFGTIKVFHKDTPEGKSDWLELNDTPNSYAGQAGKFTKVNAGENALEFTTVTGGEITIQNAGVDLATAATTINFAGTGVTAAGTGDTKTVTIDTGLTEVKDDTTPQLGGDLDTNGHAIFNETKIDLAVPNAGTTVLAVNQTSVQYFQQILVENSKDLTVVGGDLKMAVATGGTNAGNIEILGGVKDKDGQLGNPGQVLSSTGTQVDWIDSAGASSETIYQGSMSKEMDPNIPDGYGHGINLGQTGYTDTTTYPQQMPTYSDSSAGNGTGILNAFDGDEDTYSDLTPPTTGGWSKISFTNPLGLRTDGTKEITRITIGFDGTGKFGYNGGNTTTISTGLAGTVQEEVIANIDLMANPGTAIQLDDLYFESVSASDELRLYYVIIDTNDSGHGGGTKLTIEKHELGWNKLPTTGKNFGFYLHDDGDIWRNPEGLGFRITPSLANATIGVKTDQPRWLVLPLGSKCTLGDTITILDLGMGRERRDSGNSYRDSATTSGNAGSVPILIYPASEDGIQGTHRVSASDLSTFSYSGPLKTTGILAPEPFHGTPIAITENGESIKLMWCGIEYGWRYLP